MKVSVTRSGGFAGLRRTWAVTVDEQPDRDAWDELLGRLPWGERVSGAPQPDRYVYEIRCSGNRATLPEQQLTGVWRELVNRVRDAETSEHSG
jgi:hypothetical protein